MTTFKAVAPTMRRTRRGVAWKTMILVDGQQVAHIHNLGDGGCDHHEWLDRSVIAEFVRQADTWNIENGVRMHVGCKSIDDLGLPNPDFVSMFVEDLMQKAEKEARP